MLLILKWYHDVLLQTDIQIMNIFTTVFAFLGEQNMSFFVLATWDANIFFSNKRVMMLSDVKVFALWDTKRAVTEEICGCSFIVHIHSIVFSGIIIDEVKKFRGSYQHFLYK